jgi:hypothetical protein
LREHASAKVEVITTVPEAIFLNGMAVLSPPPFATKGENNGSVGNMVHVADSTGGLVYTADPLQKCYKVFYSDSDTMLPASDAIVLFGINGVRITNDHGRTGYLYYSTSFPSRFYRARLSKDNVVQGEPESLSSLDVAVDDLSAESIHHDKELNCRTQT